MSRVNWPLAGALVVMGALLAFMYSVNFARAHDHSRPELNDWYRSLQSRKGPCCGGPDEDATQLTDLQWRTKGEAYEVFVEDQWVDVPVEAIVTEPNKAGRALVWLYHFDGHPVVRCFMPGSLI